MSIENARAHYIGKSGHQKLNCAQSVAQAYKEKFALKDDDIARLGAAGGGRAPEGQCGALFAAKMMIERSHPVLIKSCEDALHAHAGSIHCREIRAANKLSCVGCVEKMAEFVDRVQL